MIHFIYNISLRIFQFVLLILGIFNKHIRAWNNLRKKHLSELELSSQHNVIWIHCASLGEFEQARPIIESLRSKEKYFLLLSFFSPSGYNQCKSSSLVDKVIYLPVDTFRNAKRIVSKANPILFVGVKYEFWWNLLNELLNQQVKIIYTNTRTNQDAYYFKPFLKKYLNILKKFETIYTLTPEDDVVLKNNGFINTIVGGDTRIDNVIQRRDRITSSEPIEKKKNKKYFVWGSIYVSEMNLIVDVINNSDSKCQHIIVPHHVDPNTIRQITAFLKNNHGLFSRGEYDAEILIVDSIGELFRFYSIADYVYIGGALKGSGLHNIFEPLVFGIAICFGPNHSKYPEAQFMLNHEFATIVTNSLDVEQYIKKNADENIREETKTRIDKYFELNNGASGKVTAKIKELF